MSQPSFPKRGCVIAVVVLAAVVALAPIQSIRWSGSFENAEYRLVFADPDGRPVPGVTLRVETAAGGVCHFYPVNEFLPDATPTSDAEGRMTFHHVYEGYEFGGRDDRSLVGICLTTDTVPQYVCVFLHGGREVGRMTYSAIRMDGKRLQEVTREWKDSD